MSYTADQQQRINIANAKVASAQKQRDNALVDYKSKYSNFCDEGWWSYLTDCDIKDGVSKWKQKKKYIVNTLVASTGAVFVWGTPIGTKKWTPPTTCEEAIEKGIVVSYKCTRGKGDCIKKDTCESRVNAYNAKINAVDASASQVAISEEALVNAQAELQALLNTIAGEVKNDPAFQLEQSNILASIQKNKNAWIFGLLTVTVIVLGVVMWTKTSSAS